MWSFLRRFHSDEDGAIAVMFSGRHGVECTIKTLGKRSMNTVKVVICLSGLVLIAGGVVQFFSFDWQSSGNLPAKFAIGSLRVASLLYIASAFLSEYFTFSFVAIPKDRNGPSLYGPL